MNRRNIQMTVGMLALSAFIQKSEMASAASVQPGTSTQTQRIVGAVTAFLTSLTLKQREVVQFPFAHQPLATAARFTGGRDGRMTFVGEQYGQAMWSNFPVSDVPRPGLRLGSLTSSQRDSLMGVLQVLLSTRGYRKVLDIMGSDQALSDAGTNFPSGTATYTIGIFGPPSATAPWMVQFGGHHLALNVAMAGERGVLAPVLTGAQPAVYTADGQTVRVLAAENDKAFALLGDLEESQRRQAIVQHDVTNLVLGPGHDGEVIQPLGLKASAMSERQRAMLLDLISEWAGIVNDAYATPRMAEIAAGLNDTYFAWSGPTSHQPDRNGAAYFRIQGPKLVIEFSPQRPGGDLTMHVHTIYRDPTNAYGRAFAS